MTLEETLLQVLTTAPLPLKASEVVKLAKPQAGKAATSKAVAAHLDALVSSGAARSFTGGTAAKPQQVYTVHSLERAAAALLRPHIQGAKKAPEAAKLRQKLPASLQSHFESALAVLTAAGEAFLGQGAKPVVHAQAPQPSSTLSAAQRAAVKKVLDRVNAVRTPALTLADFLAWVDEGAPQPGPAKANEPAPVAPASATAVPAPAPPATAAPRPILTEALLHEWYDADRARSSTLMIPVVDTFTHFADWAQSRGYAADSQVLRNFMQELYNNGHILLEPCERPQDLPEQERAMLVPMSIGPPGRSWCWAV